MPIEVNVTDENVQVSTSGQTVNATVSGGVGPAGPAGTITIGTVSTGAPGSSASVQNVGSSSAAVLNITIPAGATGQPGTTTWAGITGKPSTFTPSIHNHTSDYVYTSSNNAPLAEIDSFVDECMTNGYSSALVNVLGGVSSSDSRLSDPRPPTAHTHAASDITSGSLALGRIPTTLAGYDGIADADDWATRVTTAGGSVSASTMAAVYRFCMAITAAGLRDRFWRLNLFCGSSLTAALVPLYRGPSRTGTQYGGTTDTNTGFSNSTDYVETGTTGGLQGDGVGKFLSTGLAVSSLPDISTGHLAAYCMTGFTGGIGGIVTAWNTGYGDPVYMIEANRNSVGNFYYGWGNNFPPPVIVGGPGFVLGSRVSSTSISGYRNGAAGGTNTTSVTPASISTSFAIFRNQNPSAGANFFAGRMGGYSIGRGVYASQVGDLYRAWQAFQVDLGRAVW